MFAASTISPIQTAGIDTGFFARGGNIFIKCAEADV